MIGPNSGLAGIAYWINENYRLEGDEAITKADPLVVSLKEWIDGEFASGRVASLSTNELETKIEAISGGRFSRV